MRKFILNIIFITGFFIGGALPASAQYNYTDNVYNPYDTFTPYYNTYVNTPTSNSYTYTQGCYVYQYDAYTRITSLIGSNCTTNTYTYPIYQTYYTLPTYTYTYVEPTYQYIYTPGYHNRRKRHHGYNNINHNYQCTWQNGHKICY